MTIDWLTLNLPCRFAIGDPAPLGIDTGQIDVARSKDHGLVVTTRGSGTAVKDPDHGQPGSIWKGRKLGLFWTDGSPCEAVGLRILHSGCLEIGDEVRVTLEGKVERINATFEDGTTDAFTIWLCNLPRRQWPHATSWNTEAGISVRSRGGRDWTVASECSRSASSLDHMWFDLRHPRISRILVGEVHHSIVAADENVVKPGFLELWGGPDGLPDQDLRRTVLRSLEFLLGTGLGVVGTSEFTAEGRCLRASVDSAYVPGGLGAALPPALLHRTYLDALDPEVSSAFVQRYVDMAEHYDLNRAVWLYLNARNAPLDMAAGYVGAAFEILVRGYYRLTANRSRSKLLSGPDRKALMSALNNTLDTLAAGALSQRPEELTVIRARMTDLNRVSGTKLNSLFLDELKLGQQGVEAVALQARNDAAHANPTDPESIASLLAGYRALHTLFARAMFSVLGVSVRYFDYTGLDHPHRRLDEPQLGTALAE